MQVAAVSDLCAYNSDVYIAAILRSVECHWITTWLCDVPIMGYIQCEKAILSFLNPVLPFL